MFKIGKEFHLLHVVNDLDAADGWYDDVFAVRRFVRNSLKAAMRKASLVLIADFVMERAACNGSTPAGGSPVTAFPQEGCVVIPDSGSG
jgi:hypothetical protein